MALRTLANTLKVLDRTDDQSALCCTLLDIFWPGKGGGQDHLVSSMSAICGRPLRIIQLDLGKVSRGDSVNLLGNYTQVDHTVGFPTVCATPSLRSQKSSRHLRTLQNVGTWNRNHTSCWP